MTDPFSGLIETVAFTQSTNVDMLARAQNGADEGHWLKADRQGGGRGRLGRTWQSPAGNLYASTIVRLREDDPIAHSLAFVVALAVHDASSAFVQPDDLLLKWPNDVLLGGAKMAGMLLERSGDAVVVGVGVNLLVTPEVDGREVAKIADFCVVPALNADGFAVALAQSFEKRLGQWREQGLSSILAAWVQRAHPFGSFVSVTQADGQRQAGTFSGLRDDGAMQLRLADGRIIDVLAGDVEMVRG